MSAPDLSKLRIDRDAPPAGVSRAVKRNAVLAGEAFSFRITPRLLLHGLLFAVVMGVLGGFFPARRAAKMPVVEALR